MVFGNCRAQLEAESQPSVRKPLYGRRGLSHTHNLSHMTGRRGGGELHVIGETISEMRSCECPPAFESSASAGLKLVAVSADDLSRRVHSNRRHSKATYAKTFERGNKRFQINNWNPRVTTSSC